MIDWYYHDPAEGRVGPFSAEELRRRLHDRRLERDTLLWHQGLREWQPLERLMEELGLHELPPPTSAAPGPPPLPPSAAATPVHAPRAAAAKKGMSGCLIALLVCGALAIPMVGILAAIAIPAYQDYTLRAKVATAVADTAPLKLAIMEYAASNDSCPDDDSQQIAAPLQELAHGAYVEAVRVGTLEDGKCAFEVTLRGLNARADGQTLLFEARHDGAPAEWDCSGGSLPGQYRPTQCRARQ